MNESRFTWVLKRLKTWRRTKMSTRVGILGYGNLGRGVECAVRQNDDMELAAVFTPVSYTHLRANETLGAI